MKCASWTLETCHKSLNMTPEGRICCKLPLANPWLFLDNCELQNSLFFTCRHCAHRTYPNPRHDKRLNFDTITFLENPKLTRKQRDSRQKIYLDKPKIKDFQNVFILLEHKYINLYLVTPFGTKMQS